MEKQIVKQDGATEAVVFEVFKYIRKIAEDYRGETPGTRKSATKDDLLKLYHEVDLVVRSGRDPTKK